MYAWGDHRRFNSYSGYFRRTFGGRVQKISVDAGFTCPNRDGKIGEEDVRSVTTGRSLPRTAYRPKASDGRSPRGSNSTAGATVRRRATWFISSLFRIHTPRSKGSGRSTARPSHIPAWRVSSSGRAPTAWTPKLDYLAEIARDRYVAVEFGIESTCDETLRAVNRGHDFACARRAVEMAAERGLHVGAHFILGLPGETDEMLLEQVATINSLPLTTVKFHQLQVFRGTPMAAQYDADPAGSVSGRSASTSTCSSRYCGG